MEFFKCIRFNKGFVIAFFGMLFFSFLTHHPSHISVTELEYVAEKEEIQITCKWFIDDLEDALKYYSGKKYDIARSVGMLHTDSVFNSVFNVNCVFEVDQKRAIAQCLGAEIEKGVVWTYWVIRNVKSFQQLNVSNKMFCDIRPDQIHLIHYKRGYRKETHKLICTQPSVKF